MPLIKGTVNTQVKIPSVQSNEAEDDDKIILIDNETQSTTVITKKDFIYPLIEKQSADNTDFFIGVQADGSLFRITKQNLLAGLNNGTGDGTRGGSTLDPTFPRFTFIEQSQTPFKINYPKFTFQEQSNKALRPLYLLFVFEEQSTKALAPAYLQFTFEEHKS